MFRRFRLTSSKSFSVFTAISGSFNKWSFNASPSPSSSASSSSSSSSSFENRYQNKSASEILDSDVLDAAEFPAESSAALDPSIRNMTVREFLSNLNEINDSSAVQNLELSLKKNLLAALMQTITKESSRKLLPGHVHRHTTVLPYGILARDETLKLMTDYFETLKQYRDSESTDTLPKERLPLALLVAPPRQGKTLFLDCIANDFARTSCFLTTPNGEVILVFNITFNARWSLGLDPQFNLEQASNQIAMRLIAAAKGIFVYDGTDDIQEILAFCRPSLQQVVTMLQNRLQQIYENRTPCFILLMDEVTELASKLKKFPDESEQRRLASALDSEIISMVSPTCAVVVSGFTVEGSNYFSISGRPISNCLLPPICNAQLRRATSPMITLYFQSLHAANNKGNATGYINTCTYRYNTVIELESHPIKSALFFFELMKSSPGIFGTVLETLHQARRDESVFDILCRIPKLQSPRRHFVEAASNVLEWKSIQFLPFNSRGFGFSVSKKSFLDMLRDFSEAGAKKLVYLETGKMDWSPSDASYQKAKSSPSATQVEEPQEIQTEYRKWLSENSNDSRATTYLAQIGVEPTFLFIYSAHAVNEWFECFRQMLLNFSLAFYVLAFAPLPDSVKVALPMNSNNNNDNSNSSSGELKHECRCFGLDMENISFEPACVEFLKRMIELRFQVKNFNLNERGKIGTWLADKTLDVNHFLGENRKFTPGDINIYLENATRRQDTTLYGYFFEDATAIGICAQKQLRFSVSRRMPNYHNVLDCSVNRFLANAVTSNSKSATTRVFAQFADEDIIVRWIDPDLTEQSRPVQFVGQFPRAQNPSPGVLSVSARTGAVSKSPLNAKQHFTRETVLVPARPENNSLADIIFHENLAGKAQENNGVVQFWVDVKQRHSNRVPSKFADLVVSALQNPLLQSSPVKHVVHIIVATNAKNNEEAKNRRIQVKNALNQHQYFNESQKATSSDSPSYSLYFIHPDSFAFENLVSQPIARAMPLMDQQLMESWRQRIGVFPDWRKYKTTTSNDLERMIRSPKEFCEWRRLRLKDDGISTLESCLPPNDRDLLFIKNFSGLSDSSQHQLRTMCFGALLEKLDVIHHPENTDVRLTYAGNWLSVKLRVVGGSTGTPIKEILVGVKFDSEIRAKHAEVVPDSFRKFIRSNVRLGHLIDGHFKEYNVNSNVWNFLFDKSFKLALQDLIRQLSNNHPSQQYFHETDYNNGAVLGKILWNMSVDQWVTNWNKFSSGAESVDPGKFFACNWASDSEVAQSENLCFLMRELFVRGSDKGLSRFVKQIVDAIAAFDGKFTENSNNSENKQ